MLFHQTDYWVRLDLQPPFRLEPMSQKTNLTATCTCSLVGSSKNRCYSNKNLTRFESLTYPLIVNPPCISFNKRTKKLNLRMLDHTVKRASEHWQIPSINNRGKLIKYLLNLLSNFSHGPGSWSRTGGGGVIRHLVE